MERCVRNHLQLTLDFVLSANAGIHADRDAPSDVCRGSEGVRRLPRRPGGPPPPGQLVQRYACVHHFYGAHFPLVTLCVVCVSGLAEYEVLLDHTDHEYQAYGGCFNGIGASLLAALNGSAVVKHHYSHLASRLVDALDRYLLVCSPY